MPQIDHHGGTLSRASGADQKPRDLLDRLLRGREADAQQTITAETSKPFKGQCQMAAALVRCQRMNLVDDHCSGGREHFPAGLRSKQDVKRFRRRDDDVGRPATHALPLSRGSIAGTHPRADVDIAEALLPQRRTNAQERSVEIFADVVRQRLQWGDVDDLGLVPQHAVKPLAHQIVDRRHEGSQGLAGTGRGGNQHIAPGLNGRPCLRLGGSRPAEATLEPDGDGRMEQRRRTHGREPCRTALPVSALKCETRQEAGLWISWQIYGIN